MVITVSIYDMLKGSCLAEGIEAVIRACENAEHIDHVENELVEAVLDGFPYIALQFWFEIVSYKSRVHRFLLCLIAGIALIPRQLAGVFLDSIDRTNRNHAPLCLWIIGDLILNKALHRLPRFDFYKRL